MKHGAINATNDSAIRLECLKIVYRHDRDPAQVIPAAAALEDYVRAGYVKPEPAEQKTESPTTPDPFK